MKKNEISEFEKLQGQLQSFHNEMNSLVKKSPNDALNKFKLGLVNSVLKKAKSFLGKEQEPFAEFECFDDATMPTTSDVLIIVSQYLSAFEKYRADNVYKAEFSEDWYWRGGDKIPTSRPKKLEQ